MGLSPMMEHYLSVKEKYKDYMRIVVVAYDDEINFYKACGFEKSKKSEVEMYSAFDIT